MQSDTLALNDGKTIPRMGFGLWQVPAPETADIVVAGLAAGYRLVDGAAIYGNEQGMGEGLRRSDIPRDQVFVTTKVWNDAQGHDSTLRAFEASLRRTGLDRFDLYLIHWPCAGRGLFVETWRALIRLRDEGRVTSIGVSNFGADHIARLVDETGVTPALNQIELHPSLQQAALRKTHAARGIVTQSWTPLGHGMVFDSPEVRSIAARLGASPAQVVLAWHLHLGCSAIPRSIRPARLAENLAARGLVLTGDDMAALAGLDAGTRTGPDPDTFG